MEEEFMNFEKALNLVKSLAKSQGFYGRLLQSMQELGEEKQKEFEEILVKNNVKSDLDLILFFEQ